MPRHSSFAWLFACLCAVATPPAGAQPRADDLRVWEAISSSEHASDFETFLRIYPKSLLAPLAAQRLATLRGKPPPGPGARAESGGRLYRFRNSSQPVEDRGIPIRPDRLHVRLDAPTGSRAAYLPVDDEKLMAMCGDEDGCSISLGIVGWVNQGLALEAPWVNSSCRFFVRVKGKVRHWTVQSSCVQWYGTFGSDEKGRLQWKEKDPSFFVPYWSGYMGIDGEDTLPNGSSDRSHVLYTGGCVFSESPPDPQSKGNSELLPDTRAGFYLIAGTPAWGGETYPEKGWPPGNPGRACELIVED